jgi:hypothetical protein
MSSVPRVPPRVALQHCLILLTFILSLLLQSCQCPSIFSMPTAPHFHALTSNCLPIVMLSNFQLGLQLSSFTPSTIYQLPLHKIQNKHFQHLAPPLSTTSPKLLRTPHSIAIMLRVTNNRHCTSILKIATSSWKIVLSLATSTYL